jgi:hypothetical protein
MLVDAIGFGEGEMFDAGTGVTSLLRQKYLRELTPLARQLESLPLMERLARYIEQSGRNVLAHRLVALTLVLAVAFLLRAWVDFLLILVVTAFVLAAEIFEKMAQRSESTGPGPNAGKVEVTDDSKEKQTRGFTALLISRSADARACIEKACARGARGFEKKIELDPGEFRGMSLLDMARDFLEAR